MNLLVLLFLINLSTFLVADILNDIITGAFPPLKKCLHVLTNKDDNFEHILKVFHSNMIPVMNNLTTMSDIGQGFLGMNCEDYISACEDTEDLLDHIEYLKVLTTYEKNKKKRRFLVLVHQLNDIWTDAKDLNLNILFIRIFSDVPESMLGLRNRSLERKHIQPTLIAPLINKTIAMNSINYIKYPRMMKLLFDEQREYLDFRVINDKTFRISLFDCPPFVIYNKDKLDGIEYRIIKEVSKNWKLQTLHRDFSENITDPWSAVKDDVVNNRSDLATCSIWLTRTNWTELDFSYEYNSLCTTFLVPKPTLMNPAFYLVLPLSKIVWIGLLISIIITMTWMYLAASSDKLSDKESKYGSIVYCFMRVIEMTTLHGLNSIPGQMSFKIMITFWMVTCILVSTAYSSGYTSLLTCPQYGRKIETLKDMIREGIYWADVQNSPIVAVKKIKNEFFTKIAERRKFHKNTQEIMQNIEKNNYAIFVKRLGDDYVTDTERYQNASKYLSCLKECVAQHFVVFALQKNSYYKDFIDKRLTELLESGIIRYWQTDIIRKYKTSYMKHFFDDYKKAKNEPFSLSLSHTRGAFYLLICGLLLSKIVFCNEFFGFIRFNSNCLISTNLPIIDVELPTI